MEIKFQNWAANVNNIGNTGTPEDGVILRTGAIVNQ